MASNSDSSSFVRRNGNEPYEHETVLCQAITPSGEQCRNDALLNSTFCRVHQPKENQVEIIRTEDELDPSVFETTAPPPSEPPQPTVRVRRRNADSAADPSVFETAAPSDQPAPQEVRVRVRARDGQAAPAPAASSVEVQLHNLEELAGERTDGTAELGQGLLQLVRENLERASAETRKRVEELVSSGLADDMRSPDFWRGLGTVLRYQVEEIVDNLRRRQQGEYTTDAYGYDPDMVQAVLPLARFLYRTWWRVSVSGIEHIPSQGGALMVANHSGVLPFDGVMIVTSVWEEHPDQRLVRSLFNDWFATVPFLAPLLTGLGQVQALPENAVRLLREGELVCTFPEGYKGTSKLFKDRYRLTRFGRGGYVQAALRTGAPLIPTAVVGAEEIYPLIANAKPVAKLIGSPYFPITPFFPWLGLLGVIPLPSKWSIQFGAPIPTAAYGPEAADDPLTVAQISDQVRDAIQTMLQAGLTKRRSIFFG